MFTAETTTDKDEIVTHEAETVKAVFELAKAVPGAQRIVIKEGEAYAYILYSTIFRSWVDNRDDAGRPYFLLANGVRV